MYSSATVTKWTAANFENSQCSGAGCSQHKQRLLDGIEGISALWGAGTAWKDTGDGRTKGGNDMQQRFWVPFVSTFSCARNVVCTRACWAIGTPAGFENCFGSNDNETETITSSIVFLRKMTKPPHIAVVVNLFHPQTGEECIIQPVVEALGSKQCFKNCLNQPWRHSLF